MQAFSTVSACRHLKVGRANFSALLALFMAAHTWGAAPFPAESLDIIAAIDSRDELHISNRAATWVHKSGAQPTGVQINGFRWNPQQNPVLTVGNNGWLLPPGLELCGAVMHKLTGGGSVDLGWDAAGLVIYFDNAGSGPGPYEVEVSFAQVLARNTNLATNDLDLRFKARIEGNEEIWLGQHEGKWVHTWSEPPTNVTINGHAWNVATNPVWALNPPLMPELMDLQRASLTRLAGRGIVNLEDEPERLCLDIEDPEPGAAEYEAVVRVPRIGERHLVRLRAEASEELTGAPLKVYRFSAPGELRPQFSMCQFPTTLSSSRYPAPGEAYALLPGQRRFDTSGRCMVALEPGQYQFEVLYQTRTNTLVALKTDVLNISGPADVDLKVRRIEPKLYGPDHRPFLLDDLLVRSSWPNEAVSWKAPDDLNAAPPSLLLSEGQSYKIHAFGHAGSDYAAVWTTVALAGLPSITLEQDQWRTCAFHWMGGTPSAKAKGVVLRFPDGQLEIPEKARLFSNRRFFNVAYWLAFEGGRKALFQPRDYVLPETGDGTVALGGPLRPLASAQIFDDGNLHPEGAKHLWWEITLADPQNYLVDTAGSTIDWKPAVTSPDGRPITPAPLLPEDVERLGNLKDTLIAGASYRMDSPQHVAAHPDPFVSCHTDHFFSRVPPYHDWNTRAYLAKMERELEMIARARQQPLAPNLHFKLQFWLTEGLAVGGNNSVSMPFSEYLDCRDWFSHPWAIAHEMLHNFGYGHSREMNRLDHDVQEQMARFQWYVADHPEYVPQLLNVAVAQVELRFVKVDSEETTSDDGHGANAVDDNPNTYWHTQWRGNSPGLPHEIIVELVPPSVIKGFAYLPRQDESDHGTIKNYEFYVGNDGTNFGQPVKKGAFEPGKGEKIENFEPVKCRFVKLRAILRDQWPALDISR